MNHDSQFLTGATLRTLPRSLRILFTCFLITIGLGYLAAQVVEARGIGQGFNDVTVGLRLRYEIKREFAPYIGVVWSRKLGETADLARREDDQVRNAAVVAGVRVWF